MSLIPDSKISESLNTSISEILTTIEAVKGEPYAALLTNLMALTRNTQSLVSLACSPTSVIGHNSSEHQFVHHAERIIHEATEDIILELDKSHPGLLTDFQTLNARVDFELSKATHSSGDPK